MKTESFTSLKGHFLMAMPSLADPNFYHSVTCISEHTPEGAVGIIINRAHADLSAKLIFDELGIEYTLEAAGMPIYIGGPVHVNELFVLHSQPFDMDGYVMINSDLALGNSKAMLEAIAMGKGPKSCLIALGCAGWGPGQLEWELMQNAWLTLPCCLDLIFDLPVKERWETAIRRLGIDPDMITETAGNA